MKRIEAVIRPDKLREVNDALSAIGVDEVNVSRVRGIGGQPGQKVCYRGVEYVVKEFVSRTRLDVLVSDAVADEVVETILKTAHTGNAGDGLILVRTYADAVSVCVDDEVGVDEEDCLDDAECFDEGAELPSPREQLSTVSFISLLSKLLGPALRWLVRIISASLSA